MLPLRNLTNQTRFPAGTMIPPATGVPSKTQYIYQAPWDVYAMNWSNRKDKDKAYRLAVASCLENSTGSFSSAGKEKYRFIVFYDISTQSWSRLMPSPAGVFRRKMANFS